MSEHQGSANARLEAFCDGVFAIALTLLIIDIRLPGTEQIRTTADLWRAVGNLAPSLFAFGLSFIIILITWANHHNTLKLVARSSSSFVYANGFLLLTVVCVPFPTALLGDFVLTDHAAPAVVLYDALLAGQAIGWIFVTGAALGNHLGTGEREAAILREHRARAFGACALYSLLAFTALWLPLTAAAITGATWIFWLVLSTRA